SFISPSAVSFVSASFLFSSPSLFDVLLEQAANTITKTYESANKNQYLFFKPSSPFRIYSILFIQETSSMTIWFHLLQLRYNFFAFWHRHWTSCMKDTTGWWMLRTGYVPF